MTSRTHFRLFGSYMQTEAFSRGLAHARWRSCPVVGLAGVAVAAPRRAHLSGAAPTPVGGDGQLRRTR
jgi:hypothetical protein